VTHYQKNREKYIASVYRGRAKLKAIVLAAKDHPCVDCRRRFPPYIMDFDHREGEQKLFNISNFQHYGWVTAPVLLAEIAKCDLICSNCHRERTHQRRCKRRALAKGRRGSEGADGRAANGTRL
jgi:hypothetical protein